MAQHKLSQPATRALELSKKRRRNDASSQKSSVQSDRTRAVLEMNELYLQTTLLEAASLSFPAIEWNSEDEDDDYYSDQTESENEEPKECTLYNSDIPILELGNPIKTTSTASGMLSARKKRKLSFDAFRSENEQPHMVRSIALQSHLSDLASWP